MFARLLSDYGSLAALISYFLILSVVGQAMQVATAREGVLGHLGVGARAARDARALDAGRWLVFTVVLTVVSVVLRDPIAAAVGVKHDPWAAAIGIPAGCLWLELSILRGALQGVGDYKAVGLSLIGEQGSRLVIRCRPRGGRASGSPARTSARRSRSSRCAPTARSSCAATSSARPGEVEPAGCRPRRSRPVDPRRAAWAPIAGLIVIAVLQNIDIIAAKHRFTGTKDLASSYAATAVAAKVLIWVAIGAGFYLVPEVSRRRAEGKDTRPVLLRRARDRLRLRGSGAADLRASPPSRCCERRSGPTACGLDSLLVLGLAFTVLAATYLAIQYMLALKRTWFLLPIGVVAVAEPILLLKASRKPAASPRRARRPAVGALVRSGSRCGATSRARRRSVVGRPEHAAPLDRGRHTASETPADAGDVRTSKAGTPVLLRTATGDPLVRRSRDHVS